MKRLIHRLQSVVKLLRSDRFMLVSEKDLKNPITDHSIMSDEMSIKQALETIEVVLEYSAAEKVLMEDVKEILNHDNK